MNELVCFVLHVLIQMHMKARSYTCAYHTSEGDLISGDSNGTVYVWPCGSNSLSNLIKHAHEVCFNINLSEFSYYVLFDRWFCYTSCTKLIKNIACSNKQVTIAIQNLKKYNYNTFNQDKSVKHPRNIIMSNSFTDQLFHML